GRVAGAVAAGAGESRGESPEHESGEQSIPEAHGVARPVCGAGPIHNTTAPGADDMLPGFEEAPTAMSRVPALSQRAGPMPASPIRRLAPFAVEAQRAGKTVYALNIGQPDIATPKEILDRLKDYPDRFVPYGPSQGLPEFVEALRGYYETIGVAV